MYMRAVAEDAVVAGNTITLESRDGQSVYRPPATGEQPPAAEQ